MPRRVPRLIDLHIDWLLQYAPDTELFRPEMAEGMKPFLGQADGYLSTTSAAVIAIYRDSADWARQDNPWHSLGELITRVEAEFSGRILIGPDDVERWRDDPDGMTWAVMGVKGFDSLVRVREDLDRLSGLFERGVRVFQPIYGPSSLLGGSAHDDEDRGLSPFGQEFLEAIFALSPSGTGPRPALDLAHMNRRTVVETLDWFEADMSRRDRVIPIYSHGTPEHDGFRHPRALAHDSLRRLRKLGGWVGLTASPPFHREPATVIRVLEEIAEIPFRAQKGFEGIAIGTDLLGLDETLPGLGTAYEIRDWLMKNLPASVGPAVIHHNAEALFARLAGK